jgi:AraC-like DNA-binding protein
MAEGLVLARRVTERGVHETAERAGAGASEAVVRHYVGYEEWPESGFVRREVARHGVALILGFGDPLDVYGPNDSPEDRGGLRPLGAFVVGNQLGSSLTGINGHQVGIQVELSAAGALALFGDVEVLSDAVVPLDEALGRAGRGLVDRLAETPSWAERLDLLDSALGAGSALAGSHSGLSDVPALAPEVAWLRRQLESCRGRARVEPLMDETGWSRRHVTERFRRQLGVTPKAYARLLRFEHASALLNELAPGRGVSDVAMEAGYYDQSHLTRDFVALAGVTPGTFAANAALAPEVRFVQDTAPAAAAQ